MNKLIIIVCIISILLMGCNSNCNKDRVTVIKDEVPSVIKTVTDADELEDIVRNPRVSKFHDVVIDIKDK